MSKRKTTAAIVAGVAAVALLLGATFAWTSISQQARNETIRDINPGGRLHDDFNGVNKDIYVENFTDENDGGVNIFARIRLDEYMEIGLEAGKNKDNAVRNVITLDNDTTDSNIPKINDVTTWETYVPGTAVDHKKGVNDTAYTAYWDWTLGRTDDLPYYMPTFNKNKDSLKADINGTYEGLTPGDVSHYDDYNEYAAGDTAGGTEIYDWDSDTKDEDEASEYDNGGVTYSDATDIDRADVYHKIIADSDADAHAATQISTGATVITMDQWLALPADDQIGPFWVYDEDGWAYWAQPIAPGTTTGLLLDGINMTRTPDDNWYYGINVIGQFCTAGDWTTFFAPEAEGGAGVDSMTPDAKDLMERITGKERETIIYGLLTDNSTSTSTRAAGPYTLTLVASEDGVGEYIEDDNTYNGQNVVEIYTNVGKKLYKSEADVPWHAYRAAITNVSILNQVQPNSVDYWFMNMTGLLNIDGLTNLDTSKVTSMVRMFYHCTSLTELDVTGWDVSNVTNFFDQFIGCTGLQTINGIGGWDTSAAVNMQSIFNGCTALKEVDLSEWKVGNVTNMNAMFTTCTSLTSVGDLSKWDTSKVLYMSELFYNCNQLASHVGLNEWDVSNVTTMQGMFAYNPVTTLDLSKWNTGSVTNMGNMFRGCSALPTVTGIENWNVSNVQNMDSMFRAGGFTTLDLSKWNVSNVTDMGSMFYNNTALTTVGKLNDWRPTQVQDMGSMFSACAALAEVGELDNWGVDSATNMHSMFAGCQLLASVGNLDNWNVDNVKSMGNMFQNCQILTTVGNLKDWNVEKVEVMNHMFYNCQAITTVEGIDVWQTNSLNNVTNMFFQCYALETLDLSGWNVSKVTNMSHMFYFCTNLTDIGDISNWDVGKVGGFGSFISGCKELTFIGKLDNWNVEAATDMHHMFRGCTQLTGLEIAGWKTGNVRSMPEMFMGCAALNLDLSGWDVSSVTSHASFNTGAPNVQAPIWPDATPTTTAAA